MATQDRMGIVNAVSTEFEKIRFQTGLWTKSTHHWMIMTENRIVQAKKKHLGMKKPQKRHVNKSTVDVELSALGRKIVASNTLGHTLSSKVDDLMSMG